MRTFIEVIASGEWDDELQDYDFEAVDTPTFFAEDQIQWMQIDDDSVIVGIIGYTTVFRTSFTVFNDSHSTVYCIRNKEE